MTKDRRLGRGLAALLGTPLEEDGTIDGSVATSAVTAKPSSERAVAQRPAPSGSPQSPDRKPAASGTAAPAADKSTAGQPSLKIHTPNGLTGSVSLADRKPAAGMSVAANAPASTTNAAVSNNTSANTTAARSKPNLGSAEPTESQPATQTLELKIDEIDNNPFQPRRKFNESEIASLAESIREHQQLQPILVRRVGKRYQLISGERRLRATIHAGFTSIRAEVREADDRLVAELAIVENLQRKDLDAIEKAMSFRRYIDEHKCTQEDLAKRLKIDRSTIANLMRLLELPQELQTWVQDEKLTAGHARTLLPLSNESQQLEFARRIIEETWTVRETERQVADQLAAEDGVAPSRGTKRGTRKRPTPQVAALEQQIRLSLGAKTEIRQTSTGRGKIIISFTNADEFERLCGLICPQIAGKAA